MLKTINKKENGCLFCGRHDALERHHCFGGANRRLSEEDNLCVWLCHWCHNEPPNGVHFNRYNADLVRKLGQRVYEKKHTREEFRKRYGKSYL